MNNIKKGLTNEYDLINHINSNKYIDKMNVNIATFLKEIFKDDLINTTIRAEKYHENYKPDIVIEAKNKKIYISIKSGQDNSVHQEHIHSFCSFLSDLKIKNTTINLLKEFHFNDGSINGSGKKKKSAYNFYRETPEKCFIINYELNQQNVKEKCLNRILFDGEYYNLPSVDYIYHGSVNKGIWASKKEILEYLLKYDLDTISLHISKIYCQSWQRNLKNNTSSEFRRYYIQFKWHTVEEDLIKIKQKVTR